VNSSAEIVPPAKAGAFRGKDDGMKAWSAEVECWGGGIINGGSDDVEVLRYGS
jgi:hypothetical protein